jgi:acyl-homoserine lactone acylase PvdQ
MRSSSVPCCLVLLAAVATAHAGPAAVYGRIELIRDRWGVPHVFAETDADPTYGRGLVLRPGRKSVLTRARSAGLP